jgi:hypothetical protein
LDRMAPRQAEIRAALDQGEPGQLAAQ